MGLASDGAVERKAILVGGERFGRRVGPGEGRVLEGEGSAAGAGSHCDAVADRCSIQLVQCVGGFQVEPGLFGVLDEEPVAGESAHDALDQAVKQALKGFCVGQTHGMESWSVRLHLHREGGQYACCEIESEVLVAQCREAIGDLVRRGGQARASVDWSAAL